VSRRLFRTIFISDVHLGSRGAQAGLLASFLKRIDCERLYLVGDVVDFWRLRSRPHWPVDHHDVLRRVLKLVHRGTQVIIVPGNHDEALRQYDGLDLGGIMIRRRAIHRCADGRVLLVTHGDQFDLVVKHSRLLGLIGSAAYEWLLGVNRLYNRYRRMRGKPYWSLAQYIKLKVKSACSFVSRFQETLVGEARGQRFDGVVCGHIHKPELTEDFAAGADGAAGLVYANCGDWIENCTAIVEHVDGALELIEAQEVVDAPDLVDEASTSAVDASDEAKMDAHLAHE
jgi:UDP-2,3-diacylglucosamine pyrophosphatase LpxH